MSPSDAELVAKSLAGEREAFGQIVGRYQTLICSLAYSATGSLAQSQDLAQDTFLTAWKQLAGLREPEKLRPWLCGIARNRILKAREQQGREPSANADSLEGAEVLPARQLGPSEQVVTREEEALLWRALETIPNQYREPLVLFYRESQSVGSVAEALELSENAVKQRLSRGRKLLREQVAGLVEDTLARTRPGKTFTLGVLAALPALSTPAKAAAVAGSAATGTAAAKGLGASLLGAWLIGPLSAVLGTWLQVKLNDKCARDEATRRLGKRFALLLGANLLLFTLVGGLANFIEPRQHPLLFALVLAASITLPLLIAGALSVWFVRGLRRLRREQGARQIES